MLPNNWHRHIFLFGIIALGGGVIFGAAPMSIAQAILVANWLLEKKYSEKWQLLKTNKIFWITISLFILHIVGLLYTNNFTRGLEDVKIKLPLLLLPIVLFSSKQITKEEVRLVLFFFSAGILLASIWCYFVFWGYTKKPIIDARQASVFISHIRFSLCIAFSIFWLVSELIKNNKPLYKISSLLVVIWLLFFMYKLEMATGFICLIIISVVFGFIYLFKYLNKTLSLIFITVVVLSAYYLFKKAHESLGMFQEDFVTSKNYVLYKTYNGNLYYNDTTYHLAENGKLIMINICDKELIKEWSKRSKKQLRGLDNKGNDLYYSLIRYMSSKGLYKDSLGIWQLSKKDIENIENGISNYKYSSKSGLAAKWRDLVWEYTMYQRKANPSGHSLSMRVEFWKTAMHIIKKHPVIGVGTGDVQDAFNAAYVETNSKLDLNWRLRSHNQYLAITVAFGSLGLFLFLIYLFYPVYSLRANFHYLFWPFYLIVLISFFTEDTLETQAGVTFFAFYYSLFLQAAFSNKHAIS